MSAQYEADGNRTAAADYSTTGQYLAVAITTGAANQVTLTTTDGQIAYGILQNAPVSGAAAEVAIRGKCKAMLGDTVTRGQLLKAEVTTSRLVPVAAAADYALGFALESGVDGDIIDVMLVHQGRDSD